MKDAVRVHRLLLHAASQLERAGGSWVNDLVLDVISAGFEVQQFITTDDIDESDFAVDLGWRDAIQQAFQIVADWPANMAAAAFAIRMDNLRRAATSGSAA
jgi:hypothetical protein